MSDSILDDPRVQRLVKIQDTVRAACPGEDVEIVDADAVYVNFEHRTAVVISEFMDQDGLQAELLVVEWDPSGGVHSETLLGRVRPEYVPAVVKAFLEENERHNAEVDRHLEEGGAFEDAPRKLVDPDSFTHIQRIDNDGNPIGEPTPLPPLPRKDA